MVDRRGARVVVLLALVFAGLVLGTGPAVAAPSPAPSGTGKYYIVAEPSGGQRESLYEIAAKTLGNGNRSGEIFDLNKGRTQPDGGKLTDPLVLSPGWILILPDDAKGTGVHTGQLPRVSSVAASPSVAGSARSGAASPAGRRKRDRLVLFGVCAAFILLIAAVVVVRSGRRAAGPPRAGVEPGPPPRPAAPASPPDPEDVLVEPLDRPRGPGRPGRAGPGSPVARSSAPARPVRPERSGPPARLAAPEWPPEDGEWGADRESSRPAERGTPPAPDARPAESDSGPGEPDVARSSGGTGSARRVDVPDPEPSSGKPAPVESPEAEPSTAGPPPAELNGSAERSGGAEPPSGEDTSTDDLVADLVVDGSQVAVSLVGVTGDRPGRAYGWRSIGQAPPVAALPVVLGDRDGRRLHLDLGRCPDVFTVTGALPDCEKYALGLVRQVLANGHGVAVVGDGLFGDALPAGCRRVASIADARGLESPGIVVCGGLTGPDAAAARLSRASGGPTPVIIGDVARSRWSLRVSPA